MITGLLKKIFGSRNERLIKQYRRKVAQINALEPKFEALTDTELQAKTEEFRQRFARVRRSTRCCLKRLPCAAKPASA